MELEPSTEAQEDHITRRQKAINAEAVSLYAAEKAGVHIQDALETPDHVRKALELFCQREPEEAYWVKDAILFREEVKQVVDKIRNSNVRINS